ncbi:MAG: peptide deformylase [Oscillospiraceae bacterium]|nr:peptide deformylase [Oscillospiraceae bacterium]
MAIRNILMSNDPALRKRSRPITEFNDRLHILLDDMHETLVDANGLGLAAPQVGILRRVALIIKSDPELPYEESVVELINPEIIAQSGNQEGVEGCLSVPGVYGMVNRPQTVLVKAQDRNGKFFEITCADITARAACHEVDHLNGVVFTSITDYILSEEELEKMYAEKHPEDAEEVL